MAGAVGSFGCLRCQVTWFGARECWICGDKDDGDEPGTFIVGSGAISLIKGKALARATFKQHA